jgi:hypothetical protein
VRAHAHLRLSGLTFCALVMAVSLSGCVSVRLPWQKMPLDSSAGFYDQASIEYRVDAGKLQQPLDVARFDGQRVAFEQVASSPLAEQSMGTLKIVCPHPRGRVDLAQVTFAIDSTKPQSKSPTNWKWWQKKQTPQAPTGLVTSQPIVRELWVLDIPRTQADEYFKLLASQSFYNTDRDDSSGTRLTVQINSRELRKNWQSVPEFNLLAQRVRREGRLVEYSRPGILSASDERPITNTQAYRNLVTQTAAPGAQMVNVAANPFAMPQSVPQAANVAQAPAISATR